MRERARRRGGDVSACLAAVVAAVVVVPAAVPAVVVVAPSVAAVVVVAPAVAAAAVVVVAPAVVAAVAAVIVAVVAAAEVVPLLLHATGDLDGAVLVAAVVEDLLVLDLGVLLETVAVADLRRVAEQIVAPAVVGADEPKTL